nr:DUF5615 family PIN-like protein [Cupriavidus sp. AcVe19-6a]
MIDECLWPGLARQAVDAGYWDATCLRDRGLLGTQDPQVMEYAIAQDYVLVTHNAVDFRGRDGQGGLYGKAEIHPGLICLSTSGAMTVACQQKLFGMLLERLREVPDLINQALELEEQLDGTVTIRHYQIPR